MTRFSRSATWITAGIAVFAVAPAAHASPPTRVPVTVTSTSTLTDVCAFPVVVSGTVSGVEMIQDNGTTSTISATGHEQDTLSANGVTLTGLPYSFRISLVIDDNSGNILQGSFSAGVVEKVPLPDGRLFITAGRVDEALHADQSVGIVPDVGNTGDIAALCAALS